MCESSKPRGGVIPSPRAIVYNRQALDGLILLGLLDDMLAEGFASTDSCFRVWETGEVIPTLTCFPQGIDHPYNVTLGIDRLCRLILRHIERFPHVAIDWNTRLSGLTQHADRVDIQAETPDGLRVYPARWVVGADGGRSAVRRAVGEHLEGYSWPDRFVATNVMFDFEKWGWHPRGNSIIDTEFGAIIVRCTTDGLWRVTFHEDATLPVETVQGRIATYMASVLPGDQDYSLELFSPYTMHQRCVRNMRVGRVLLAGDAAHLTNPTSGFGLIGGLFDAYALCDTLSAVIQDGADEALLSEYARLRRKVFLEVASPVSCESKRRVFHLQDKVQKEAELEKLRHLARNPELSAANYGRLVLETPSLITGLTRAQVRAMAGV